MTEPHDLRFHEPFPVFARVVLGLGGALTFLAPYELLIRPGVDRLMLSTAPLWFISVVAVALGLSVIALAVAGLVRTVLVDPYTRTVRVDMKGSFGLTHTWRHSFDSVVGFAVRREDNEGPATFAVEARLAKTKRPLLIARLQSEPDANSCVARIRAAMRR